MKILSLPLCLILVACGDGHHEPATTVDAEDRPKGTPMIACIKDDPKNIVLMCDGNPRICRAMNRCEPAR